METARRIVEIFTGDEKNQFKTVRLDFDFTLTDEQICEQWCALIEAIRARYETQVRFVPPKLGQDLRDYMPPIPGETNWDWSGEEEIEI